jgi:stage V sporulation protein R
MPLWSADNEWSFSLLEKTELEIDKIAKEDYKLDTFPNQIEIISSEQMMDAYSSNGLPVMYNHWSFGKSFSSTAYNYKRGRMGLAYEIVINSNPCISYLMEENTMTMQTLVIAHAAYGHNSFFKNNYLFKEWTNPDFIIDYLIYAKQFIRECEEKHGFDKVEALLDSCHTLSNYAVDSYKKPNKLTKEEILKRELAREEYLHSRIDGLEKTLPSSSSNTTDNITKKFLKEPEENVLKFIENYSPMLEDWQREVIKITRRLSQYLFPQSQTKIMNEGWASFWHYTILNRMYDKGLLSEGSILEFLESHSGVIYQPSWNSKYFNGINPYNLGFNMFKDIKRICEEPTTEDKEWFPQLVHTDWLKTITFAMENFKDESFIQQYLSPKLIRELGYFRLGNNDTNPTYIINAIQNESGYKNIRNSLAEQQTRTFRLPSLQVMDYKESTDRNLLLKHSKQYNTSLSESGIKEILYHVKQLWGFEVHLFSYLADGETLNKIYTSG